MRAKLEFDMADSDDASEFRRATKASEAFAALWEISQEIFRPARKHGYSDTTLSEAMDSETVDKSELIHRLEVKFYSILEERGIDLSRDWS